MKNTTEDLFGEVADTRYELLAAGAWLLHGFALAFDPAILLQEIGRIQTVAPFRHLETPGGFRMSVAMTNCGALGWVSDRRGYRYQPHDPLSGKPWPPLPATFRDLAKSASSAAGFQDFVPDACLINRYLPGARLTSHQDKDEETFTAPIVSVSLGLPAVFLFGGDLRSDKHRRVPLRHGDVVVWGGAARLHHHGVLALKQGSHPLLGGQRLNLTFRRAR